MKKNRFILVIISALILCTGCNQKGPSSTHKIRIEASAVPQAQMLEYIEPDLKKEGVELQILIIDDYNIPNRALADDQIDANFFQHFPFLEEQIRTFKYPLCVLAKTHIEPMGLYSKKISSLEKLPNGSKIAIPNDPVNEARALLLLQSANLLSLKKTDMYTTSVLDIDANPHHYIFKQVDAALLPRTLEDVEAAIIPTNYALQAGYSPLKNALLLENANSPYVNVVAIRCADQTNPTLLLLKKWLESDKMRQYILQTYQGAVLPAF